MTERPFGGESPFQPSQRSWQQPEPAMATSDIDRLQRAQVEQQQRGLTRAGVLVLSISTAVLAILAILGVFIWAWASGAMLGLFGDSALEPYLNTVR